jgi:hypothetical protein
MLEQRWERWAAVAGLIFFPLVVASIALTSGTPGESDTVQKFASYVADNGHQTQAYLSAVAGALAGIFFLWFLAGLRGVMVRAEGAPGYVTGAGLRGRDRPAHAAGGGDGVVRRLPGGRRLVRPVRQRRPPGDGHVCAFLLARPALRRRRHAAGGGRGGRGLPHRVPARWLTWFTVLVALGQLLSIAFFLPGFLALVWVLVLAIYMLASRRPVRAAPPAPSPVAT